MAKTNIGWASSSWNPYTWNCHKISPGCKHCYMFEMSRNLRHADARGVPQMRESAWSEIDKLPAGPVFINSMSDTYHPGVPVAWIHRIHNAFRARPHLTGLLLTKRIERAAVLAPLLDWPPNLWIGTTVENQAYAWRLDYLRQITQAAGRFVSFEPMIGPVWPDLSDINWVIVGGESGAQRRPFDVGWASHLLMVARGRDIPFFYKQGSHLRPGKDRVLAGRTYDEVPAEFGQRKNWQPVAQRQKQSTQLTLL